MSSDFNLTLFIEEIKGCKPPYRCPFEHCGKVYKTFQGIQQHLPQCQQEKDGGNDDSKENIPRPFFRSPHKETLVYTESQKMVEFEADGRTQRFSIYDALSLVAKEDYEASIPPELKEKQIKKEVEVTGTPTYSKGSSKKRGKAQRFSMPKNPSFLPKHGDRADRDDFKDVLPADRKVLKLPEASFKEIANFKMTKAPSMPTAYFDFVEKSQEELDKEIEYDMDEEDVAWLRIMNEKRKSENLSVISEDQFELLMDRLEKESYFQVASSGTGMQNYAPPVDEDAICCVCMDGEATNTNVILFCDLCNLAVHQECYGVPYIPEGQWLCRRCLQSPSRSVECCLCPNKGGAFKQTDDGRWAHVVCAMWIPEVRFANTVFLEPIDSIANIPPARWKLSCRICRQRGVGACIQCHKNSCYIAFHVTCGLLAGLHMRWETVREGGTVTVRKTACCDQHTPADSDAKPRLDDVAALGIITPKSKLKMGNGNGGGGGSGTATPRKSNNMGGDPPLPILFRGLMNFSPQCPWDKVQKIASLVEIQKKSQFIQRLMAYWTLKRQTRNGVPLIRRLQFAKASKPPTDTPEPPIQGLDSSSKDSEESEDDISLSEASSTKRRGRKKKKKLVIRDEKGADPESGRVSSAAAGGGTTTDANATDSGAVSSASVKKKKKKKRGPLSVAEQAAVDFGKMLDERRRMRRLRQDLERVRLLCELIRKREQRKRELVHVSSHIKSLELNPFQYFLSRILDLVYEQDSQKIFKDPVDTDAVADYLDLIKQPMDLSTMRSKLDSFTYNTLDDLEADFHLMVNNCLSYNERETIFYRAGVKMRDQGGSIFRQARRQAIQMGFDPSTGIEVEGDEKEGQPEDDEESDNKLMKEVDSFIGSEERETMDNEEHLNKLLEYQDRIAKIHHPVAKKKRHHILRVEIKKLRRKICMDNKAKGKDDADEEEEEEDINEKDEPEEKPVKKKAGKVGLKGGKKRLRSPTDEAEVEEEAAMPSVGRKRKKVRGLNKEETPSKPEDEDQDEKAEENVEVVERGRKAGKGITGVNRRNAVLFTRKKAVNEERGSSERKNKDDLNQEEANKPPRKPSAADDKSARKEESTSTGQVGRPRRRKSMSADGGAEKKSSSSDAAAAAAPNDKSTTADGQDQDKDEFEFSEQNSSGIMATGIRRSVDVVSPATPAKGRGRKGRKSMETAGVGPAVADKERVAQLEANAAKWTGGPTILEDSLFKTYRSGGAGTGGLDTDTDTGAESANDTITTDDDTSSDSGDESYCGLSAMELPLEPLDLVWAKCRGYPWCPALIINPKMPRTGYFHNGVPIPVPPVEVLQLADTHTKPHYLILFFDTKRTWQWLPRDKLEPLGVDTELDKTKLIQSKKPSEKKAVKKAYEEAILHRCRVTGETVDLHGGQTKEQEEEEVDAKDESKPDKEHKQEFI